MESPGTLNRSSGVNPFQECVNQAIGELFEPPFVETAIDRCYRDFISPSVQIVPSSTEIFFNANPCEDYTSLKDTLILVRLKIQNADGSDLPAFTDQISVGLEQFVTTSLFKNIQHNCCNENASGKNFKNGHETGLTYSQKNISSNKVFYFFILQRTTCIRLRAIFFNFYPLDMMLDHPDSN